MLKVIAILIKKKVRRYKSINLEMERGSKMAVK